MQNLTKMKADNLREARDLIRKNLGLPQLAHTAKSEARSEPRKEARRETAKKVEQSQELVSEAIRKVLEESKKVSEDEGGKEESKGVNYVLIGAIVVLVLVIIAGNVWYRTSKKA